MAQTGLHLRSVVAVTLRLIVEAFHDIWIALEYLFAVHARTRARTV